MPKKTDPRNKSVDELISYAVDELIFSSIPCFPSASRLTEIHYQFQGTTHTYQATYPAEQTKRDLTGNWNQILNETETNKSHDRVRREYLKKLNKKNRS